MMGAARPFDWHLHPLWLLVFPALLAVYVVGHETRGLPGDDEAEDPLPPGACSSWWRP